MGANSAGERRPVEPHHANWVGGWQFANKDGAPDGSDLEHTDFTTLLQDLEGWEQILSADPLISEKLRDFDTAADPKRDSFEETVKPIQTRGPSL